jgi:integrase
MLFSWISTAPFYLRYGWAAITTKKGKSKASDFTSLTGSGGYGFQVENRSSASHLVMVGIDLKTVQELLGHKIIDMTFRYSHLFPRP